MEITFSILDIIIMEIAAYVIVTFLLVFFLAERLKRKIKQSQCIHQNKFTHVQTSYATCEETVETCLDCFKILSKKTDCR